MATPWEVDTAVYAEKSKYVGDEDYFCYGVAFSSDGSKMYIAGNATVTVYQYTLSTPWDVSTAEYATKLKDVSTEDTSPYGIAFSLDGTKMYIMGYTNDTVYQYTLSTAWDVSTATYAEKSKYVGDEASWPRGVAFSSDGSKMYIMGTLTKTVYQYTLDTAWDVSSADYADKLKDVGDQDDQPFSVAFSSDGSKMYIMGIVTETAYQYTLSNAWDVDTATYVKSKYVGDKDNVPNDVDFSPDGTKMYIMGEQYDTVFQYSLPAPPKVNAIMFGSNF